MDLAERRRQKSLRAQLDPRLPRRVGLDYAGNRAAGGIQRLVLECFQENPIRASRARPLQD
jgi:hypothetical protein